MRTTSFDSWSRAGRASCFTLAALLAAGCGAPAVIGVQDTGTVTGTVVDAKTLAPISQALVYQSTTDSVFTGPSGTFTIVVPVGNQPIRVHKDGYVDPPATNVVVTKDATVPIPQAIALQPIQ